MSVRIARFVSGAAYVPGGLFFLLRSPSLWPLAALPVVVAGILLAGGVVLGAWAAPLIDARFAPEAPLPLFLQVWRNFFITVAALAAGAALAFGIALLLVSPILDRLSRRVEGKVKGVLEDRGKGLSWEVGQSLRGALYFLAAAPGIFLLAFVPLIGPALALLWGGYALGFQFCDPPLTRRGLDFREKRAWHRRHRAETLGFGVLGFFSLLVPLADLLVAPALAAGATLLVLRLEVAPESSEEVSMTGRN